MRRLALVTSLLAACGGSGVRSNDVLSMPPHPLVGTWECSSRYEIGTMTLAPNPYTASELTALGTWSLGPAPANEAGATLSPDTRRVHVWFNHGTSVLYDVDAVMS